MADGLDVPMVGAGAAGTATGRFAPHRRRRLLERFSASLGEAARILRQG